MNWTRILLASLGGFVIYFVFGGILSAPPSMRSEFLKYPQVYRPLANMKAVMPAGMLAIFASIVVLAVIYAWINPAGSGMIAGLRFGALIGVFAIGAFVFHNYVNLNIGLRLTLIQAVVYFIEWVAVGVTIGLIYKPRP